MKNLLLSISIIFVLTTSKAQDRHIHVNQFGYYMDAPKVAVLSDPMQGYNQGSSYQPSGTLEVRKVVSDEMVFSAEAGSWNGGATDGLSGDRGWHFDFSAVVEEGEYYIIDPGNGERSPAFKISDNPYLEVLKSATRMFYYNRCGLAKQVPFADERWTDDQSFQQDEKARYIYDQDNESLERELTGGWFDAGDFNKYVTFTYSVVHNLLSAYESSPEVFADDWNIPESGNGIPDILDEVKWELDWMEKMLNSDGSVIIKMGSRNHNENTSSPPSANSDTRYYGPTCTAASATLASNFAHAALVFKKVYESEDYAKSLAEMAGAAFEYVLPFIESNSLETGCDDGSIVAGDADLQPGLQVEAMVNAAIYLWEFTGLQIYHDFILTHAPVLEPIQSSWWGPYKLPLQDALMRYTSLSSASAGLTDVIMGAVENSERNNDFYRMNDNTLYRDYIPDWSYHWGSNNPKAGYGNLNLLMAQYSVNDQEDTQREKAEELLHSFHGVNPLGIVYLSNMYELGASHSVNEVYHIWFADGTKYDHALDSEVGPAPGFVSGGPNKDFSIGSISPPSGQPPTKSYLDYNTGWPDNSWEISEPAIYYQANYIRLLSQVIGLRGLGTSSVNASLEDSETLYSISPNPASEQVVIKGDGDVVSVQVVNVTGKQMFVKNSYVLGSGLDVGMLIPGTYVISVSDGEKTQNLSLVISK